MRFVAKKARSPWVQPRWLIVLAIISATFIFEIMRWIIPFESRNPLYQEVTIGEPVIAEWVYNGVDEEGYLRFFNRLDDQTVVLPPDSHLFGADGRFVVLEHHTPTSLTYAEPIEALPTRWILVILGLIAAFVALILWRFQIWRQKVMKKFHPQRRIMRR
ncbi:hypothetical protein FY534_02390 [Alicyclobacillus sp. TC]|uniref:Uncharacterized protein n=2 Tax=Alicyclobacillus tolerans TaxID=90970 RepID=A0A1M6P6I9_9BACL|nr:MULTISPECIES: hypothetical protein [Alicyclobacillus]MDP9729194.1 hypothetical protein [Alicyclobacillus tengchongensis]QRF22660.1 hypothetical protein FY534_02390 [Alicyclobacillus sp. TC]SHK03506.1 hypothetical protein SAMN05443507_107102 [Alicyclobacillus montanus]